MKNLGIFVAFLFLLGTLFFYYVDLHTTLIQSVTHFKFYPYLLIIQLLGVALFGIVQFINSIKIKAIFYSPIFLTIVLLFISLPIFYIFEEFISKSLTLSQTFNISFKVTCILIYVTVLFLIPVSFLRISGKNYLVEFKSLNIACSLGGLITVIFILGSFGFLNLYSIAAVLSIILLTCYKSLLANLKSFIKPIQDHQNINYWGFIIFYLLLIALTINFLAIQSPYPYGFDARNYYMNSTQLIAQSLGLIEGFQPYNWQLFMSLGFILFDSHEVAISLSFFAFILCLIAINDFTKDIFKLDINYRLLIMLLITVSPAFYNQLSIDVKIDFALLFYQIVIVHFFVKLCQAKEWNWKLIIIFGLLNGFALGIKFTHLYLLASMIIVYWGIQGGVVALISGAAISVGAFLIAKIDDVGGLRSAHLGVDYQQWIVLAIGAGLFIFLAISEREKWLKLMRFSLLFGAIAIIPMLPWMGKNYIETKSLSPKTLLMGKAPGYQMNLNSFIKNYEAQK